MSDSIWKKEFSLGRKSKRAADEPAVERPAKEQGESFWKKEITIGKRRPAQAAPAALAEVDVEHVTAPPPLPAPALSATPADEYSWLTSSFDPNAPAPAAPPLASPRVAAPHVATPHVAAPHVAAPHVAAPHVAAPPVAPPQVAVPPVAPPQVTAPPVVEPVISPAAQASVQPVAPEPAVSEPAVPEPAVPEPAVPEAEAEYAPPPLSAPAPMPSIAFTPPPPLPSAPIAPPAPVAPPAPAPEPAAPVPAAPAPPPEPDAKTPFWKKEFSLGGGKSKEPKAAKEPKATREQKSEGEATPFWKKELGGRKRGEPKAEKQLKIKTERAPKASRGGGRTKQTLVGLKIGASQIAAARVSNGASPELVQLARHPLDDGIVVGGELRDLEGLAETLKRFFAEHKLPKKGVRLGIANNRIGVRTFEITGIEDPKQLANAIRFRAQETLPIPLEEAVLDWQVLSEWQDPETGATVRRVLLVVAYRELVDRYVAACRKAGIRLSGIDLEAFAMLRALTLPVPDEAPPATGAQVVVNVGHDRSTFAVSDGRVCEFTRVLGWGGSAFSVAIARALDITPSEADPIKHALSLVATAPVPEGIDPAVVDQAREAVRRELQSFARELVSSLRFYQNQPSSLGIGELVLTGGTAHLPGFADELERLIGVPVRVGDPLARVRIAKKLKTPERIGSLAVAIGLGIDG